MPFVEDADEDDTFVYLTVESFTETMTTDRAREVADDLRAAADTIDGGDE